MKILAFSDSHHDVSGVIYPIQSENPDFVIHLGDNIDDIKQVEKMFPNVVFHSVKGNCDFSSIESEKTIAIGGKNFFITHGHKYSVKSTYNRVIQKGGEMNADIVMFGHTHIAFCQLQNNTWIVNPGSSSITQTRDRKPSYCRITLDENEIDCEIITR